MFADEVLILDDDTDILKVFSTALEKAGLKVAGFTSPKSALDYYLQNSAKIGLIISDIRLPEMNGFEFASNIREKNPKAKVLLVTAYEKGDLETAGIHSNASLQIDEFLKKPVSPSKLAEAAIRHLAMSTAQS